MKKDAVLHLSWFGLCFGALGLLMKLIDVSSKNILVESFEALMLITVVSAFIIVSKKPRQVCSFGFDIHGVIDKESEKYRALMSRLVKSGNEVHILTGGVAEDALKTLADLGFRKGKHYTHFFSIPAYLETRGFKPFYKDPENPDLHNPFFEPVLWDTAKADYCRRKDLIMLVDDSPDYGKYLTGKECAYIQVGGRAEGGLSFKKKNSECMISDKKAAQKEKPETCKDGYLRVKRALENPKYSSRTVQGVAKETGLDPQQIERIIQSRPDEVVILRRRGKDGEQLITTRGHYKATATFTDKVMGAILGCIY